MLDLYKMARTVLWGYDMPKKPTLTGYVQGRLINRGRRMMGLKPQKTHTWEELIEHWFMEQWQKLVAYFVSTPEAPQLPPDLPAKLFNAVNTTIQNRGGVNSDGHPNFWINVPNTASNLFFWTFVVDYAPGADPGKLSSFELALEDAISRAGFDLNIRIGRKPLRIEIDKDNVPMQTLKSIWHLMERWEIDADWTPTGIIPVGVEMIQLQDMNCTVFIVGLPRSGKTQQSMTMILTIALLNSPERISMVLIDPKAMDYRFFNQLPHLAAPVINEPSEAEAALVALSKELDRRIALAAKHDMSFLKHKILVYIDEMAELMPKSDKPESNPLLTAWERLGRLGGAYGFILIGATQRAFDCHIAAYSKLQVKIVGKMRNANDTSSLGISSSTAHKLPGRGSFELFCMEYDALRIQGPFVADAKAEDYKARLDYFFNSINQRWAGHGPGWTLSGVPTQPPPGAAPTPDQSRPANWEDELGTDTTEFLREMSEKIEPKNNEPEIEPEFLTELSEEYKQDPEAFSIRTVRRVSTYLYHKELRHERAKAIYDLFMKRHAENLLE